MNEQPHAESGGPQALLRDAFAAAVDEAEQCARDVARVQCRLADAVERVRRAGAALGLVDRVTGGPAWSPEVVTQRVVVTELAAALHESESDARRRVDTASGLAGDFAATREALESGSISYRHAEKIVAHAAALPTECLADYESRLLAVAGRVSAQRLDRLARAAVEQVQPRTAIDRHLTAAGLRRLTLDPAADGMAYLTHYLPAVEAVAVYNRATDLARGLKNAGDPRTLAQLRVDTLSDLLLNAEPTIPGTTRGIRPHVRVTVPVLELLGPAAHPVARATDAAGYADNEGGTSAAPTSGATGCPGGAAGEAPFGTTTATAAISAGAVRVDSLDPSGLLTVAGAMGPAVLEGYGPIDRLTALRLTRDAPSFTRVLTDPIGGCALSYGRTRYKPPADLDELVRTVHTQCTFPIDCTSSATADLDHTEPWSDGGRTEFTNIAPLCASHHKVKHHTDWRVEHDPSGSGAILWTSPAGHQYVVAPTSLHSTLRQNSSPLRPNSSPPRQNSSPPRQNSSPPRQNSSPPRQNSSPPRPQSPQPRAVPRFRESPTAPPTPDEAPF